MSGIQNDQEILEKGRQNKLEDDEEQGLQVTASVRDQLLDDLIDKLNELDIGQKVKNIWTQGNNDRSEWLKRQETYLSEVDEFIDPIYNSATDWGSVLHLPTILTVCKTFHARMYAALMGIDPPFTVKARQGANADRARIVQELMRYTLKDWVNEYTGVEDEVDAWIWDWVTSGNGLLKARWHKKFTRFADVEMQDSVNTVLAVNDQGENVAVEQVEQIEVPVIKTEKVFDGPELFRVNVEDVLIVGGKGDPQKADFVGHRQPFTRSELLSLADQKIFKEDAVERIIKSGKSPETSDITDNIKAHKRELAGETNLDRDYDIDRYNIIEAYIKVDVDGSGIDSDVIVWVDQDLGSIVRATYLRRVMPTGLIPFFKIDFHKRHDTEHSVGLVELLYSLGKEIDAIHNMRIDTGMITSLPWGFFRPTNAFKNEKLPVEPGALIPTNDPQRDVFFPNLGNRTSFGFQEEAALNNQIERLTSINDLSLGVIGGQGATRTATGAQLLAGETNANLDIFLQRMNRGWKRALKYLFNLLQQKLPPGFEFRITGEDSKDYFIQLQDREELAGMYDFELEANSANSNPGLKLQRSNQIYQMTQNPIDLQLGIIGPRQRYEAVKNLLQNLGVKDFGKYVIEPAENPRIFTPMEVANRVLSGIDVVLDPTQDLQGFVNFFQEIIADDDLLGQFSQAEVGALAAKSQEAEEMLAALQAAQNEQAVIRQQGVNREAFFGGGLQGRVEASAEQGVLGD